MTLQHSDSLTTLLESTRRYDLTPTDAVQTIGPKLAHIFRQNWLQNPNPELLVQILDSFALTLERIGQNLNLLCIFGCQLLAMFRDLSVLPCFTVSPLNPLLCPSRQQFFCKAFGN